MLMHTSELAGFPVNNDSFTRLLKLYFVEP